MMKCPPPMECLTPAELSDLRAMEWSTYVPWPMPFFPVYCVITYGPWFAMPVITGSGFSWCPVCGSPVKACGMWRHGQAAHGFIKRNGAWIDPRLIPPTEEL